MFKALHFLYFNCIVIDLSLLQSCQLFVGPFVSTFVLVPDSHSFSLLFPLLDRKAFPGYGGLVEQHVRTEPTRPTSETSLFQYSLNFK